MNLKIIIDIFISTALGRKDKPPASLADMFYMTEEDPHRTPIMLVCEKWRLNVGATHDRSESPFNLPKSSTIDVRHIGTPYCSEKQGV